jgi:hypothetical protein
MPQITICGAAASPPGRDLHVTGDITRPRFIMLCRASWQRRVTSGSLSYGIAILHILYNY